jgi:hypothetical protein
MDLGES